jgi:hypothetical protein
MILRRKSQSKRKSMSKDHHRTAPPLSSRRRLHPLRLSLRRRYSRQGAITTTIHMVDSLFRSNHRPGQLILPTIKHLAADQMCGTIGRNGNSSIPPIARLNSRYPCLHNPVFRNLHLPIRGCSLRIIARCSLNTTLLVTILRHHLTTCTTTRRICIHVLQVLAEHQSNSRATAYQARLHRSKHRQPVLLLAHCSRIYGLTLMLKQTHPEAVHQARVLRVCARAPICIPVTLPSIEILPVGMSIRNLIMPTCLTRTRQRQTSIRVICRLADQAV